MFNTEESVNLGIQKDIDNTETLFSLCICIYRSYSSCEKLSTRVEDKSEKESVS